ncbi:MAG TPA: LysR family transcriptional regulator [Rubrivivax sp.]|nr:LysR family transcriptional regulator [Rubrivivax sp.]
MSAIDHSDIDGRLLQLLLAVLEERSVTRAAARLDVTQSAVSHQLDRLRAITGDALFVKSGRGIMPTARAEALAVQARRLLDELRAFAQAGSFDPAAFDGTLTIAANELQRDLLLPLLLHHARVRAPRLALRIVPSGVPTAEMLRDGSCLLAITPRPPEAADVVQRRLFDDRYVVYYDAQARKPPAAMDDYLAAEHVCVHHETRGRLDIDRFIDERGMRRRIAVTVAGFSGVAPFLRGSAFLATLPVLLRASLLRGFATVAPPFPCPPNPMFMAWHQRHQEDPMHRWLRDELLAVVAPALAAAELPPTRRP